MSNTGENAERNALTEAIGGLTVSYTLKCDPNAYIRMKEIISMGEFEGFDGAVAAVKAITGKDMSYTHVAVEICLPPDPIFPDGYGYLEPKP